MRKIPSLFKREFKNHEVKKCLPVIEIPHGADILLEGTPTIKYDGACCMIKNTIMYKRYDAKKNKIPPANAIPCQPEPDPITGHWPHWVPVDDLKPEDKWFWEAYNNSRPRHLVYNETKAQEGLTLDIFEPVEYEDGTYEAVGPHFQNNPYHLTQDFLYKHGAIEIHDLITTYDGVKQWLESHNEEGIVWWYQGEPRAKIKRSDFGLPWNQKKK